MTGTGQRVLASLTAREKTVLTLLVTGLPNRQIGTQLGITEQVIKNYLRNIYDKTGQSNRLELVIFLLYHGIVECPCARKASL